MTSRVAQRVSSHVSSNSTFESDQRSVTEAEHSSFLSSSFSSRIKSKGGLFTLFLLLLLFGFFNLWPNSIVPTTSKEAYVSLLTTAHPGYLVGLLTLVHSLRRHDPARDVIVLYSTDLPDSIRELLEGLGAEFRRVEPVREFYLEGPNCRQHLLEMNAADRWNRWGHMFTKLRAWQLTEYSKVVFLDSDTLATPNITSVWKYDEMSAEKGKSHPYFNCGFMVLKPSRSTFDEMAEFASSKDSPVLFNSSLDCTEQAFLNNFFPKFTPVVIGRPDQDTDLQSLPLIHWITLTCSKPWNLICERVFHRGYCFLPAYRLWLQEYKLMDKFFIIHNFVAWPELLRQFPDGITKIAHVQKCAIEANTYQRFQQNQIQKLREEKRQRKAARLAAATTTRVLIDTTSQEYEREGEEEEDGSHDENFDGRLDEYGDSEEELEFNPQ